MKKRMGGGVDGGGGDNGVDDGDDSNPYKPSAPPKCES